MTRRALALAALALAACNKGSAGPAFRLAEPSSLAVFWGFTSKQTGTLHPYIAVANTAEDELVFIDPVDNSTVAAPIVIRPLSVPLPDPRPALVASARFRHQDGNDHADLLVAASAGATSLQLLRTWYDATNPDPDLAPSTPVDLGAEIIALLAIPEVDATGTIVADRAWVVASLVGGSLAVTEYQLTEGSGEPGSETYVPDSISPVTGTATFQALGFEALSLAVDPSPTGAAMAVSLDQRTDVFPQGYPQNPYYLYAASLDPIAGTTYGVAQFDMRGTTGSWALQALDAHAPTKLAAAYTLRERRLNYYGGYIQENAPGENDGITPLLSQDFADVPVSRVYAYVDPQSCGPTKAVACGVEVLDPVAGDVLEDPWNPGLSPKQYLPPIDVVADPLALVPVTPPSNAPSTSTLDYEKYPTMLIASGGVHTTTGVLAMPSSDGRIYFADLARWELPDNQYEVATYGSQTEVTNFVTSSSDAPQIALFKPAVEPIFSTYFASSTGAALEPSTLASEFVQVTPGFTPDDLWSVTYQGYLPDFVNDRAAEVEDAGSGQLLVSLQSGFGTAAIQVVNVFDPAYGVRVGDSVELRTTPALFENLSSLSDYACPDVSQTDPTTGTYFTPIEGKIVSVDPPDANHPGGSLVLTTADCVPLKLGVTATCEVLTYGPWTSKPGCWAQLLTHTKPVPVRIRAGGGGAPDDTLRDGKDLVVLATDAGYLGRATTVLGNTDGDPNYPSFSADAADEATLVAACPLIPYPSAGQAVPPCDESCRRTCEAAAVARRVRRRHLVSAYCAQDDTTCTRNFCFADFLYPSLIYTSSPDPLTETFSPPSGPAIAFSVGVATVAATATDYLVRDTQILITTHGGYVPTSRWGAGTSYGAGSRPFGAVVFDRSADPNWNKQGDGARVYVPYVGNAVLDVSPSNYNSDTRVLR